MLINYIFQELNLKVTSASEKVEVKLNNVLVILWENTFLMLFFYCFRLVYSRSQLMNVHQYILYN